MVIRGYTLEGKFYDHRQDAALSVRYYLTRNFPNKCLLWYFWECNVALPDAGQTVSFTKNRQAYQVSIFGFTTKS